MIPTDNDWGFTVADALEWLGLPQRIFTWSVEQLPSEADRNPIWEAMLAAKPESRGDATPEEILARHGIDPENPAAAVETARVARDLRLKGFAV